MASIKRHALHVDWWLIKSVPCTVKVEGALFVMHTCIVFCIKMACGGGRGTGKPCGKKKQQSWTASPARKRTKLVEIQSSKEACVTSSRALSEALVVVSQLEEKKIWILKEFHSSLNSKWTMCGQVWSHLKHVNSHQSTTDAFMQDYYNIRDYFMGSFFTGYSEIWYSS